MLALKHRRNELGLSQSALAERLSALGYRLYQQTIAKIESGSRSVGLNEANAIATALETTINGMIEGFQSNLSAKFTIEDIKAELFDAQEQLAVARSQLDRLSEESAAAREAYEAAKNDHMTTELRRSQVTNHCALLSEQIYVLHELVENHNEGTVYRPKKRGFGFTALKPENEQGIS